MTTETIPLTQDQGGARPDGPGAICCANGADTVSAHSGDAPSRGQSVTCASCGAAGIVSAWSFGVKEPDECSGCYGSGRNWRYPNGMVAKHYGGPFVGRDSDSRRMAETGTGSVRSTASAGRQASPQPSIATALKGERA